MHQFYMYIYSFTRFIYNFITSIKQLVKVKSPQTIKYNNKCNKIKHTN